MQSCQKQFLLGKGEKERREGRKEKKLKKEEKKREKSKKREEKRKTKIWGGEEQTEIKKQKTKKK